MGVFKEEVQALEELERHQIQIWPDSAERGVVATEGVKDTMRSIIKTLLELKESSVVWKSNHLNAIQRHYELTVYFSMEDGVTFDVLYFKGRGKEFFSIYSRRAKSFYQKSQKIQPPSFYTKPALTDAALMA